METLPKSLIEEFALWLVEEEIAVWPSTSNSENLPMVIPAPAKGGATPGPDDLRERTTSFEGDIVMGITRTGGMSAAPLQEYILQPTFDITIRIQPNTVDYEAVMEWLHRQLRGRRDFDMGSIHINEMSISREPFMLSIPDDPAMSYRMSVRFWYFEE